MTEERKIEMIIECLEGILDCELIEVHNNYCINQTCMEDYIYSMEELNEVVQGTASEVLRQIDHEDFNLDDEYFIDTIYGYRSFTYDFDSYIDFERLAEYILTNNDELGNGEILTVLDEIADEEENEED